MKQARPIPDSYRVDYNGLAFETPPSGQLLAGEYPGAREPEEAREKIDRLLDAGVNLFIDLTEAGEYGLHPYAQMVAFAAGERGARVSYQRLSIKDMSTPSRAQMGQTLDVVDAALAEGYGVYVHCYGGIGRTGTVIGCWLVRHGLSGRQALAKIGAWRRGTPDGWRRSPETEAQLNMVLTWRDS